MSTVRWPPPRNPHSYSASVTNILLRASVSSHKTQKPLSDCRGILVQPNRNAPLLDSRTALYHQSLNDLEFAWLSTDSAAASFQDSVTRTTTITEILSHTGSPPLPRKGGIFFSIPRSLIRIKSSSSGQQPNLQLGKLIQLPPIT